MKKRHLKRKVRIFLITLIAAAGMGIAIDYADNYEIETVPEATPRAG